MRKSLTFGSVLFALFPLALHASDLEVGLLLDKEVGKAQTLAAGSGGLGAGNYDAVSPTGVGFRAGYTFLDLKVAGLGAAVTYRPKAQGDLVGGGSTLGKYGNEYVAIGVQADWKFLVNLHAGLDYRSEKLTTTVGSTTESTTLGRPWVKAGFGFSAPTPLVKPFVRLEVAAPLSTSSKGDSADELRKAMAPSFQVALYGGIRF
jgi:hypothetical protein